MDVFERFFRQTEEGRRIERYRDNYDQIDWSKDLAGVALRPGEQPVVMTNIQVPK